LPWLDITTGSNSDIPIAYFSSMFYNMPRRFSDAALEIEICFPHFPVSFSTLPINTLAEAISPFRLRKYSEKWYL
jgi:hypothetical protein